MVVPFELWLGIPRGPALHTLFLRSIIAALRLHSEFRDDLFAFQPGNHVEDKIVPVLEPPVEIAHRIPSDGYWDPFID
jgi:hypothetical protein